MPVLGAMFHPTFLGWVVGDRACAAHDVVTLLVKPSIDSIDRHRPRRRLCERGATIRPGLRRFKLCRETEEGGLVAEGRHELDAEGETGLRPGERHRDRRIPCGIEEGREAH